MKDVTSKITYNGILAAIYAALTLSTFQISYMGIQFRFAEILVLLVFFRKDSIVGLAIGCALANIFSFSAWDILFGTLATIVACLGMMFMKHLLFAALLPPIINGIVVGLELHFILNEPLWLSMLTVFFGELAVMVVGYILFTILKRRKTFLMKLGFNQNLDFKL